LTIRIQELSKQQDAREYDWEIQFIFGAKSARIIDHRLNHDLHLDLKLDETVTEETFRVVFADLCEALRQEGKLKKNGKVLCTTFPAGSKWADVSAVN